MLPNRAGVDMGVMATKGYSVLTKTPALHTTTIRLFRFVFRTLVFFGGVGVLTPLQGYSRCILHSQPTFDEHVYIFFLFL